MRGEAKGRQRGKACSPIDRGPESRLGTGGGGGLGIGAYPVKLASGYTTRSRSFRP